MVYKLVKKIKREGWPTASKKWKRSHVAANKATLKAMGSKVAKRVNKIKVPKTELLGSHTKSGKIIISKRVPKTLRGAIAYHERVEHRLMTKKKK